MTDRGEKTNRDLLIEVCTKLEIIDQRTERMQKAVFFGNGRPSMLSRLDALESSDTKRLAAIVGSMIVALASGGVTVAKFMLG